MAWSPTISYNDFVIAVQQAYSGGSSVTWSEVSQALARGGCATDNYLQYLEQYPSAVDIVKNADGSIRAARINPYASIYDSAGWDAASAAGSYNSNLVPAISGSGSQAVVTVPGNAVVQQGSTSLTFTQGLSTAGNFVMKEVVPAVAAAGIGIKLGKAIDGAIYDIGTALGLAPPESLNPETWNTITADDPNSLGSRLFNMVFGIDANGNTQAYIDQDAFAYMSLWLANQGFFTENAYIQQPIEPSVQFAASGVTGLGNFNDFLTMWSMTQNNPITRWNFNQADYISLLQQAVPDYASRIWVGYVYQTSGTITGIKVGAQVTPYLDTGYTPNRYIWSGPSNSDVIECFISHKYDNSYNGTGYAPDVSVRTSHTIPRTPVGYVLYVTQNVGYNTVFLCNLRASEQSLMPDGVTNQSGATLPDASTWTSPQATLDSLRQQYPELFQDEVTNTVVQPDGTIREYHYIPIGMPERDGSTGTQSQQDTQVNPDDSTQTLIDFITQILTQVTPVTDPQTEPDSDTDSPTGTDNPPDTGDGDTPIVPPVSGSASSLWKIYNPSQSEIDAFGAWLWSSNFIEQIKKLFNDPMQAIIGVHKVFCTPSIGGTATIKCGYLDSEVSSNWVSDQYTHIDCGTVQLPEYFGNVFDYDPFTRVSIFIPCVGIVPLDVAEVMRASINVKLHCDVLTGAMLAEVYVNRDGAGGNLYTYSGSCIVTYPVSSGTYVGAVANVVATAASVTAGIMGTVATGGALAPAVVGAAGAAVSGLSHTHTNVQHSGAFSGAAGVMGGKIPYLIITRPQTRMAQSYESYDGVPANYTSRLGACSGYVKVKEVHLKVPNAYKSELEEIESMLYSGILI